MTTPQTPQRPPDASVDPAPGGGLPAGFQADFFQTVRMLEQSQPGEPRVGHAMHPRAESLRIHQNADLDCAPATVERLVETAESAILEQRFFGLLGPHGPLPLHTTEQVRERSRHQHDRATEAFLNVFNHRMATLFYRAWAAGRGAVQHDRPREDRFAEYLAALTGGMLSPPAARLREAEAESDGTAELRAYFTGRLAPARRNAEGLTALLQTVLKTAVEVRPFALHAMRLDADGRTRLGGDGPPGGSADGCNGVLGQSAVLGRRVADRAGKIEVCLGPLRPAQFAALVPGGADHDFLRRLVRGYIGPGLHCRVTLRLRGEEARSAILAGQGRLGVDGWLGSPGRGVVREDSHFEL